MSCQLTTFLTQVDVPFIHRGDVVRLIDDMAEIFSLQKGHGEWVDDMALVSGAGYLSLLIYCCVFSVKSKLMGVGAHPSI